MAIQCELCGSTNIVKQENVFVCQGCGVQYTPETLRKMVSVTAPQAEIKQEETAQKVDVTMIFQNADQALKDGNKEAAETYLSHALKQDPDNFEIMYFAAKHGLGCISPKRLLALAPADLKDEVKEFIYRRLEDPAEHHLKFTYQTRRVDMIFNARDFLGKTLPEIRIEGFWDEKRYLVALFRSIVVSINAYQLPEALPDGILADAHLYSCCESIETIDGILKDLDSVIPDVCRPELHEAFSSLCKKIVKAKWYTRSFKDNREHKIGPDNVIYYSYIQKIKEIGEKHQSALYAFNAKREAEETAAKKAAQKAYWDAHPEEYQAKIKTENEKKLRKLETELKQAESDLAKMQAKEKENEETLDNLSKERASLGFFQGKRKKQLLDEWCALFTAQSALKDEIVKKEEEQKKLASKLAKMKKEMD